MVSTPAVRELNSEASRKLEGASEEAASSEAADELKPLLIMLVLMGEFGMNDVTNGDSRRKIDTHRPMGDSGKGVRLGI